MTKIHVSPPYRLTLIPRHAVFADGDAAWAAMTSGRSITRSNRTLYPRLASALSSDEIVEG